MRKYRRIAHPDWLKNALNSFERTSKLYQSGILPGSIEFFMLTTPVWRLLRCCFPNRWDALWWVFKHCVKAEFEAVYGALYRFWRYRICLKSQDADMYEMTAQVCPRCRVKCEITKLEDDKYKCSSCGAVMDFGELVP